MWERIRRELLIEYYWWKRHRVKKRQLDSPLGMVGILCIGSGFLLIVLIGQAIAAIFRNMIPIVAGAQVAGAYWSSIVFALKISLFLMIFIISIILILFYRLTRRRR